MGRNLGREESVFLIGLKITLPRNRKFKEEIMKKILCTALCLAVILSMAVGLTSCHIVYLNDRQAADSQPVTDAATEADATQPATDAAEDPTESVDPSPELMSYDVQTAREETYSYTDGVGNHYNIPLEYPKVIMDSEDADALNKEIAAEFDKRFDDAEDNMNKGVSAIIISLDYDCDEVNGVLSICIREKYDWGQTGYFLYSLDLRDGTRIADNDEMLDILGLDEEDVLADMREAVKVYYRDDYPDPSGGNYADQYNQAVEKTLSDENLANAVYYVRAGSLYANVKVYTIAGAGMKYVLLEVTDI